MKKLLLFALLAALLLAACPFAAAAHVSGTEALEALSALGLLRGTGEGLEPDRPLTRAEALVMLIRLMGLEEAALSDGTPCPFTDGGWASDYLGYAGRVGLVTGKDALHFGGDETATVRDYLTLTLRALDYADAAGDFCWAESIAFSDSIGLTHGEYSAADTLLREDMALISYTALTLRPKDSGLTLAERLYRSGAVSAAGLRATRLAYAIHAGETKLDAREIHETCAGAVFYIEMYEDEEAFAADKSTSFGSGFFVTGDGVGVLSYHELNGSPYARVTASDGKKYDVTGVLFYDPLWDAAVIRVSLEDTEGGSVRFFPWLETWDSDAVSAGETVYTVSNPLGLKDCVSDGILSNRSRCVDDPAYPMLQTTAPISKGSSGGPLLNGCGQVIGILAAMYTSGQNLNLAVPINCISHVSLTGEGIPLKQVKEIEDGKKAAATLTASETELALTYGESRTVMITHDCPGTAAIQYQLGERGIVECEWGSFETKHSVPLTVRGVGNGETDIEITFADVGGNKDASLTIHVAVTRAPEEEAEKPETGVTGR